MVNHFRTLLLNRDGSSRPSLSFFGEEYVPPDFNEISLPSYLCKVRDILFGEDPDDAMMNYHLRRYMSIMHSTEFVSYVTELDPRITYDVRLNEMDGFPVTTTTELSPLCSDMTPAIFGEIETGLTDPVMRKTWIITVESLSVVSVQYGSSTRRYEAGYANGMTDLIPLWPSSLHVRVLSNLPWLQTGAVWSVDTIASPNMPISSIIESLGSIMDRYGGDLFGPTPRTDPYDVSKQLWEDQRITNYKLAGVLIPLVYRTEEVMLRA